MLHTKLYAFLTGKEFKKFLRFAIVGGATYIINTSLQWFVRRILLFEGFFSIAVVFLFVSLCHFLLNNFFAFRDTDAIYKRRIFGYVFYLAVSTLLNALLLYAFLTYLLDNVPLATAAVTAVMMLINFTLLNRIVFKESKEPQ